MMRGGRPQRTSVKPSASSFGGGGGCSRGVKHRGADARGDDGHDAAHVQGETQSEESQTRGSSAYHREVYHRDPAEPAGPTPSSLATAWAIARRLIGSWWRRTARRSRRVGTGTRTRAWSRSSACCFTSRRMVRCSWTTDAVNALFCKREKRQAAEWLLDEEELSKFGVTATQLAQIFEGPPSVSPTGYPRGTPLAIPTDAELDGGAVPAKMPASSSVAAAAQIQAAAARARAARRNHPHHSSHGGHHHRGDHYAPHAPHAMFGGGGHGAPRAPRAHRRGDGRRGRARVPGGSIPVAPHRQPPRAPVTPRATRTTPTAAAGWTASGSGCTGRRSRRCTRASRLWWWSVRASVAAPAR